MIRRPPRSTPLYSSAASDVYKRQVPQRPRGPQPQRLPGSVPGAVERDPVGLRIVVLVEIVQQALPAMGLGRGLHLPQVVPANVDVAVRGAVGAGSTGIRG